MDAFNEVGNELIKALALGLLVPFFAPIFKFFDKSRKHNETKRKLELIKLIAEVDNATGTSNEERKILLSTAVDSISQSSSEIKQILFSADENSDSLLKEHSPFSIWDSFAALFATIIGGVVLLIIGVEREYLEYSFFVVMSSVLSLLSAKFIVCRWFKSAKWQLFWNVFSGFINVYISFLMTIYFLA